MAFPDNALLQAAVYWGSPVPDGGGGYTFAEPRQISCRWVDKQQTVPDPQGELVAVASRVQVAEDLEIGGYLMLGTLASLDSGETDPQQIRRARRIVAFNKTPDLRAQAYYREALL